MLMTALVAIAGLHTLPMTPPLPTPMQMTIEHGAIAYSELSTLPDTNAYKGCSKNNTASNVCRGTGRRRIVS